MRRTMRTWGKRGASQRAVAKGAQEVKGPGRCVNSLKSLCFYSEGSVLVGSYCSATFPELCVNYPAGNGYYTWESLTALARALPHCRMFCTSHARIRHGTHALARAACMLPRQTLSTKPYAKETDARGGRFSWSP